MRATAFEFLEWFYGSCDFGPAHEDVMNNLKDCFVKETGMRLPIGYGKEDPETGEEYSEEDL